LDLLFSEIRGNSENTLREEIILLLREGILLLQIDFDDHIYMLPGKGCGDVIQSEGEKWKIEERKKQ
jgi:hypothetical protein